MVLICVISTNIVDIDLRSNKTPKGFNNSPCKCTGVHIKAKIRVLHGLSIDPIFSMYGKNPGSYAINH